MKKKSALQGVIIIAFLITLVLVAATFTELYVGREIPFQIVAAFISVAMMGVVTWVLLNGQSRAEEEKNKNIKIFQKKLKIYAKFNQALWDAKDKDALTNLLDRCMQELVLVLPREKMGKMREFLGKLKGEIGLESSNEFKAMITAILKADITEGRMCEKKEHDKKKREEQEQAKEEQEQAKEEQEQAKTERNEKKRTKEEQNCINELGREIWKLANVFGGEQRIAEKTESKDDDAKKSNPGLSVNEGQPQYWHFAAWDNEKQNKALQNKNSDYHVLSLMEYDEDWRTARLRQVEDGDVLFLFNRGGAGYVGMYRAIGNCIIHNLGESGVRVEEHRQGEEPKKMEYKELPDGMRKYDIYEAFDDGATYVSSVIVEKIKELDDDTCNPINVIRQTIARLSKDNVEALLRYFDGKSANN